MFSTPPKGGTVFVEALEARIAPTGLYAIAGNPAAASDPHYISYATAPTASSLGFVKATTFLPNAPADLYAIRLTGDNTFDAKTGASTGDELVIFNSVTGFNLAVPTVQANKGPIIAFFLDDPGLNGGDATRPAGQVYANELVGISVGKKGILTVNDNVYGDIVSNLLDGGNTVSLTSDGTAGQGLNGLTMNGNIVGHFLADGTTFVGGNLLVGGNIKNVNIVGTAHNVLAGTATNGASFDFSGGAAVPSGTITSTAFPTGHVGASITNVAISGFLPGGRIQAGDGGLTAIGGSITNLRVLSDTSPFEIYSGAGGDSGAGVLGGTGGAINQVIVRGVASGPLTDPTVANPTILIQAGHGGNDDAGHGGTGGTVNGLALGFEATFDFTTNTGPASAGLLTQDVVVVGGAGGEGVKGGNGGLTTNVLVNGFVRDDGVTNADGTNKAEIQVFGGAGGAGIDVAAGKGRGGAGGDILTANVQNLFVQTTGSTAPITSAILIQGGAGGAGKSGGNVSDVNLLGAILTVNGGDGGSGLLKGGQGGSLDSIIVSNLTNLYTSQLTLNGGTGGDAVNGRGGNGGSISSVELSDSELTLLQINTGVHANGGRGGNGVGGNGGAVGTGASGGIQLQDSDPSAVDGAVGIRSGTGGDGTAGGGAGGNVDTLQLLGVNFSFGVTAGNGGSSIGAQGQGGAGGDLNAVGLTNASATQLAIANPGGFGGIATAGNGGNGSGAGGLGGAGGGVNSVNLRAIGDIAMTAGNAGNGPSGAGVGGSFNGAAGRSLQGGITATAGAGAQSSGGYSDGGSISGFIASAQNNIVLQAGNGGSGGAGGSITASGVVANELTALPNVGNVLITAGNGSSANGIGGAGGSVTGFTGLVGDGNAFAGFTALTAITAGNGGGGTGANQSGKGGNVDTIKLTGVGNAENFGTQVITIDGGNAGVADAAKKGKSGGSVTNVTIFNLDADSIVQHVAAGDASSGIKKGGAGGNVDQLHVGLPGDLTADIGVLSGAAYGYALGGAGGIFAGVGGTGHNANGANGSVTNVTARAIASIVAGKGGIQLCTVVSNIDLEGLTVALANADGSFSNFDSANVVGSVYNDGNGPTAPGATTFKQGDGLIAAANLLGTTGFNLRNFEPEAVLTNLGNDLVLADYLEQNAQLLNTNPIVITDPAPAFLG